MYNEQRKEENRDQGSVRFVWNSSLDGFRFRGFPVLMCSGLKVFRFRGFQPKDDPVKRIAGLKRFRFKGFPV